MVNYKEEIIKIIDQYSDNHNVIDENTRLDDQAGLDSLDRVCVAMDVEAKFGVEIDEDQMKTIGGYIQFLEGNLK